MWHHHRNAEREDALFARKKFEEKYNEVKATAEASKRRPLTPEEEEKIKSLVKQYLENDLKN